MLTQQVKLARLGALLLKTAMDNHSCVSDTSTTYPSSSTSYRSDSESSDSDAEPVHLNLV